MKCFKNDRQLLRLTISTRGIGAGIAIELGRRGANVVISYTSTKSLSVATKVVNIIQSGPIGAKAVAIQGDVAVAADRQKLVNAAVQLSPAKAIEILVHNAGNGDDRYLVDLDEEFYDMQMNLNLKGGQLPRSYVYTQCAKYHVSAGLPHSSRSASYAARLAHCDHIVRVGSDGCTAADGLRR